MDSLVGAPRARGINGSRLRTLILEWRDRKEGSGLGDYTTRSSLARAMTCEIGSGSGSGATDSVLTKMYTCVLTKLMCFPRFERFGMAYPRVTFPAH